MVEGLGLGLVDGGSGQGGLGLGGRSSLRQKLDLLTDGAAEVIERFADVGRVIVGFVGVLRAVFRGVKTSVPLAHGTVHSMSRKNWL